MKTRAAVLRDIGKPFEIVELDLDEPKAGEVRVKFAASGLCHSDDHLRTGDIPVRYPIVGGHEGAGTVEAVGEGVTRLAVGDHIVASLALKTSGKTWLCNDVIVQQASYKGGGKGATKYDLTLLANGLYTITEATGGA